MEKKIQYRSRLDMTPSDSTTVIGHCATKTQITRSFQSSKKETDRNSTLQGFVNCAVHLSSIVFEVIRTISSQLIYYFYEKILNAQKRKSNKSQLTKQKQANKKQQRQQFPRAKKRLRG